jgi:hypothetical protein
MNDETARTGGARMNADDAEEFTQALGNATLASFARADHAS